MLRKQIRSKNLIAAVAGLVLAVPAGLALAQTTSGNGQDQAAAANQPASKKSVRQLTEELKKEDKQMRQSNAELKQASKSLAHSQHQLEQAKMKEQHLASAERNTANAERQTSRNIHGKQQGTRAQENSSDNAHTGTQK